MMLASANSHQLAASKLAAVTARPTTVAIPVAMMMVVIRTARISPGR